MTALPKFLVLLAIFLLAIYANTFLSESQVAGNKVQVNYLIWFDESNNQNPKLNQGPTNDQTTDEVQPLSTSNTSYMFEAVNGINTSYTFEAVNGVNAKQFEAVNGMSHVHVKDIVNNQADASQPTVAKTSEGDEVNNVIYAHDNHIATGQVTFKDQQDDEIQSNFWEQSKPRPFNQQGPIQRSSTNACLVLFPSFYAIGTELKCKVHSHQVFATSS
jgi:hypothetical protein